ncbi:MAG: PEGA domain-containing protein, partial [Bryobacteraceae bacterium]
SAESSTDSAHLEQSLARVREIAALPDADAAVRTAAETVAAKLTTRVRQLKAAQVWAGLAARKKQFAASAGAVVVAIGAFAGIRALLRPVPLVSLQVTASPAGATIKAGQHVCNTAPCEFQLKPGDYAIDVRLDGYRPVVRQIHVDAAHHTPVGIALQPLPASVQIVTNFASGRVSMDGEDKGELQNGQLTLGNLPFGTHRLSVSGPDGQAAVSFRTSAGQVPAVSGSIAAKDVDAVAIGNMGSAARLNSLRPGEPVLLDGRPAGETSRGGLQLHDLSPGNRELKVAGRTLLLSVGQQPTLSLVLNADRNVGSLIVETGREDNATVTVDGRRYGQTVHGIFRLPLDARDRPYQVRVEKNGYRVNPPVLPARIQKGDEFRAAFRLEAIPKPPQLASLTLSGGAPGTQILVDGASAGVVAADGSFSTSVQAGDHEIELRKDGYVAKRLPRSFSAGATLSLGKTDLQLSPVPPTAAQLEAQDWEQVRSSTDLAAIDDFLRKHPGGAHAEEAKARDAQLRQQSQAGAARRADQNAWDAADKSKKSSLQDYLARFGSGSHAQEARALIIQIEKQDADALAAQRAQQQKEKDRAQAQLHSLDNEAVLQAVSAFEAAYNRLNLKALQSVWPGMPKNTADSFRDQFRYTKTLRFQIRPSGQPVVSGDSATVNCARTLDLTTKDGQHAGVADERVRVTLNRAGSGWVIRAITPY